MNHKKQGFALIFSQDPFDHPFLKDRRVIEEDCESMKKCLSNLGFEIHTFNDSNCSKIDGVVSEAGKKDHSQHDCIVISIVNQGTKDSPYDKDIECTVDSLMSHLSPERCPTLAGKPKIFFIQACQGDQYDLGCTSSSSQTDGERLVSYKIPLRADFLIMYSTAKGFSSLRHPGKGSWFIQTLAQELEARAYECDLLSILTYVNQRVAIEYETTSTGDPDIDGLRQIPCIVSMLTRLMKFNKKTQN